MEHWIKLGIIGRAHGIRGEVRVKLYNPNSEALLYLKEVWIAPKTVQLGSSAWSGPSKKNTKISNTKPSFNIGKEAKFVTMHISTVRSVGGGDWLVHFDSILDRDSAQTLTGLILFSKRESLPQLQENEYYLSDLIGCQVITSNGAMLGEVLAVQNFGAQDLLLVQFYQNKQELLVPLVEDFVQRVDLQNRRIELIESNLSIEDGNL